MQNHGFRGCKGKGLQNILIVRGRQLERTKANKGQAGGGGGGGVGGVKNPILH